MHSFIGKKVSYSKEYVELTLRFCIYPPKQVDSCRR